ncbi:hypothetical protein ACJJTC_018366, partial [Scirpophaga incertulas]
MDSPVGSLGSDLRRQNEELRARLAGEAADHKRRLDAYRRAQQGQAALVSRLQSKVLQYKQRCADLENQMLETTPRSDVASAYRAAQTKTAIALPPPAALPSSSTDSRRDERINDLETALRRLDEEKRKCEKLVSQNNLLRDQLEESHSLNEALTGDLQKLTNDWEALRDEMSIKEDEWKDEEQAFNDYYSSEHNRLLNLWREVVAVKRYFNELQSNTERDLFRVKNDLDSSVRELVGTLTGYSINAYATQGSRPDHQASQNVLPGPQTTNVGLETLRIELRDIATQRDTALADLRERDARIQRLLGELQGLEERCECAESLCSEATVMRSALEEVARALIHDSEADIVAHVHHEVGFGGQIIPEEVSNDSPQASSKNNVPDTSNLLSEMKMIFNRLLTAAQAGPAQHHPTQLIKFDPDDADTDIEGWCKITELVVTSRKLTGPDLLLALIHSLKGRAASCLTKLDTTNLEWQQVKQILLAKFAKPMLIQDYFDSIMKFQIGAHETASEAALRLWSYIERIPRIDMPEDVMVGFAVSVLCQRDALIRRELNSYTITTRAQLCRILSGISIKRRNDDNDGYEVPEKKSRPLHDTRFASSCRYCGNRGHKIEECRKRRDHLLKSKPAEIEKTVTCYSCGKLGHISTSCPNKKPGNERPAKKDVHVCDRKLRGILSTVTGKTIPFLFDSGSACSLIKNCLVSEVPGTVRNETVYLTGIGGDNIECTSQILSSVQIQDISLSILFHVVTDNDISESIIVGREILDQGIQVEINKDRLKFSVRKESNKCGAHKTFDFSNIDTDLEDSEKEALLKVLNTTALAYMDDVLCYSSDVTEGLNRLDVVLKALVNAGFSFNITKCKFMKIEVHYLGHLIRAGEVRPNPVKIQALANAPIPSTATQVRQFLGLASYFRRFIPNFATLAGPLYPLTKLKGPITWTTRHAEVHSKIVKILTSKPILTIFNPDVPVELHTDASSEGYGAILIQKENGMPHVVAYFSRRTTEVESRYHSYELETLAVVRAVENFRHYLYGQHFTVFTDCNSLKASKAKTDLSPRVHRWWAILQAYDFDIVYKEGRSMSHADFLSRNPLPATTLKTNDFNLTSPTHRKYVNFVELHDSWLHVEQQRDPEIKNLIRQCESNELPETIAHTYDVRNGVLYRKVERNKLSSWLPIVPRSLIWTLISHIHSEIKHLGPDKTLDKIYEQYWFPQMSKNVRKFIDSCIVCKASKGPSGAQQVRLHPIPKVDVPWHTIHMDVTGKLSGKSDRKEYASVIIDAFTKYVLLEYTQSLDAACAVKALKKAVSLFGSPKRIISDQGRCYISSEFKQFCSEHNIELHLIATGSPRANGQVERVMRTLKGLLTIIENDANKVWRDELDEVQLALNSTTSRVTGFTPTELMFGIRAQSLGLSQISPNSDPPPRADLETLRNHASNNIIKTAKSQVEHFNQGKATVRPFEKGDYVFIKASERNQTKLARKFKGPFEIIKVLDNDRYVLKSIDRSNRVYKYSHENLRAVPKGFDGLVDIANTTMNEHEDAETAVSVIDRGDSSDSETISISSEHTLTAVSENPSSSDDDLQISIHRAEVHRYLYGSRKAGLVRPILINLYDSRKVGLVRPILINLDGIWKVGQVRPILIIPSSWKVGPVRPILIIPSSWKVKLQNTREQLSTNRKQCETADGNVLSLEAKVQDLQVKLDQANADLSQLLQEKDVMQKTIESLRIDKNNLERNRIEINAMVESLTSDYEKLQKINARLEKNIESLENEKRNLNAEVDHLHREAANREAILRTEEERSSRLRSELVTTKEELNKTCLCRDLLDQQKMEADCIMSQMEKHRSDLEIELERTMLERGDLQDLVEKLESAVKNLESDKKKLQDDVKYLEDEKSSLSNQSSEQQGDLNSLRKELLAAEQNRMELEADKASLCEKIKFLEAEREKVELELRQVVRERDELSSQLTAMVRKKDALNEEIMRIQQRLEQANETIGRINRALEEHVKDGEEKQILIDSLDKDKQHLQEQLAGVRSEKDALEAVLFDTANMLEDTDNKRLKLEQDLQEALVQQENHKGQIARLTKDLENSEKKMRETRNSMQQQAGKKEAEYQQILSNLNRTSAENITKLKEEKEQLRQSLEHKLNQTIATLTSEKESSEATAREREKKLLAARDQMILQHDEAMLRAENDKQQALLMAHQEQQALIERWEEAKRALDCEQNKVERVRRDAAARHEQDRALAAQLNDELATLRARLDEAKATAEDDCARFENRIKELHLEKEAVCRECTEARAHLSLAEDKYDNAHAQLQDTMRKLKELENESDSLRKELTDTRRQLTNCCAERDKYNTSCRDLRDHVKRAEAERREAARARDEAYHKIAGLEENRTSLELELNRLQNMLKESESGGEHVTRELKATESQLKRERAALEQAQHDIKELQSRLQNESEERERCGNEAATARRQAAELEALLGNARAELAAVRQRAAELADGCRARDQELVMRLEDCRSKERRLEELKHNLEVCLADATQQIQELKARLGGCEGRCRALEASLSQCESGKREAEAKVSSIAHALRRVCGVQPDGTVAAAARRRLASPARRYSPRRGGRDHSEERNEIIEVDPELIKKGVRNLMHEVCQIEREKDDYKSQVTVMKKQLKEASDQQGKGEGKLQSVTSNLRNLQEEKSRLQTALGQKEAQLNALNENVQTKSVEISNLRDKVTSLEATLSSITEEKVQNENKAESLRVQLAERVQEVGQLREALAAAEGRSARLDVRRAQLEGDVQRAAVAARDRDQALKKLQERCEGYTRTIAALEDRCTSLKGTVEQLSTSLQKAAAAESELRSDLSKTQRQLNEVKNNEHSAVDKLRQLQKSVSCCENERRVLTEKLESAKAALGELKRLNSSLEDQVHRLTNQLANVEVQ